MCVRDNNTPEAWRWRTVEVGAHAQSVGGGAGQFGPGGQVRVGQSLIFEAGYDLAGRVAPYPSAADGAGVRVVLGHRGEQQRDVVAFRPHHRVFGQLICRFGPR